MTTKVNISGINELDFPSGVTSASVNNGVATVNLSPGSLTLKTNGVLNGSQTTLNLVAGAGTTISDDGTGDVTIAVTGGSGTGTVTSVAMTGDGTVFQSTVAGSPVTTSGTLAPALVTQAPNQVLAGPTSGPNAAPTFRSLVAGDIPSLDASKISTGQLALARGGTAADLSATGGASKVLKQTSLGGAITVAQVTDADLSVSDITTNNVSTAAHGFTPKAPNDATKFLNGIGAWSVPPSGGSFPLSIVQETVVQSGSSNVTSFAVTFPQALAASGNTAFMICACDGSGTVTVPTGWTQDLNVVQASFARLILCHKTSAGDTSATWTAANSSSFAVYFFEVSGSHALDISSTGGSANTQTLMLPSITPSANAAVFGFACFVANAPTAGFLAAPVLNPLWSTHGLAALPAGGRTLAGHAYAFGASGSAIRPPTISLPNTALFSGGGVAYASFSIL